LSLICAFAIGYCVGAIAIYRWEKAELKRLEAAIDRTAHWAEQEKQESLNREAQLRALLREFYPDVNVRINLT
jgi:hypothetical protein